LEVAEEIDAASLNYSSEKDFEWEVECVFSVEDSDHAMEDWVLEALAHLFA
jgi:hypothetical protein